MRASAAMMVGGQGYQTVGRGRPWTFYALAALFGLFLLFLYGPMLVIYILSFQGPDGGVTFPMVREAALLVREVLAELGLVGWPKTTGNPGVHVYLRLEARWDSFSVRAAAVALARELERRRPDLVTAAWWKEERGTRVFIDFNQNAPHKTVFGAWCVRARPGAQVSTPFHWDELDEPFHPDLLTMPVVAARVASQGDPWRGMYLRLQSIEPLLALHERDLAAGLADAPWPPVYPKQPNEPPRVAPSRAKKARPAG